MESELIGLVVEIIAAAVPELKSARDQDFAGSNPKGSIGLILLAAGGSGRLGRPKQLLEYQGQTLLHRAAETALASKCRPVIVVLGAEAQACAATLQGLPVEIIINHEWKEGMAGSICAGLNYLETKNIPVAGAILSVADQPHLAPSLLDSLIEQQRTTGKKIVAAQYAGVPGPPALFASSLFAELRTLQGDEGARRVLKSNPSEVILVPFPEGSLDVDTPADFEKLQPPS